MAIDLNIPVPLKFNPLKHHRNFILQTLEGNATEKIIELLDPICNNYIDIYTGSLTPEEIGRAVLDVLKSKQVITRAGFERWTTATREYRKVILQDKSEWVLRKSTDTERYIHLHPARTGKFSYRFKGSTLKTIFMLKTVFTSPEQSLSPENVNRIRLQLGLSPVKKLEKGKGILNGYETFFNPEPL
jgi:hypothetical protein